MNKLFTLVAGFFLLGTMAFAQSFQITSDSTYLTGPANLLMTGHCKVTYIGGGTSNVSVKRMSTDTASGQASYFCWQSNCYGPMTNTTLLTLSMTTGTEDTTLRAYFSPGGHTDVGTATYCFYDVDNVSDSACIIFTYAASPVGVNEVSALRYLSNVYPNPADHYAKFNYVLSAGKEAHLVITNVLGSKVKEMILAEKQGTFIIPTSDLNTGVYVCNFVVDGSTLSSRRMIVNHN